MKKKQHSSLVWLKLIDKQAFEERARKQFWKISTYLVDQNRVRASVIGNQQSCRKLSTDIVNNNKSNQLKTSKYAKIILQDFLFFVVI